MYLLQFFRFIDIILLMIWMCIIKQQPTTPIKFMSGSILSFHCISSGDSSACLVHISHARVHRINFYISFHVSLFLSISQSGHLSVNILLQFKWQSASDIKQYQSILYDLTLVKQLNDPVRWPMGMTSDWPQSSDVKTTCNLIWVRSVFVTGHWKYTYSNKPFASTEREKHYKMWFLDLSK